MSRKIRFNQQFFFQLLKNAKSLRTDKSLELSTKKIDALETELKEANRKIKDLEDREEKTEKKVRFGADVKKDSDTLKLKQDELDKLKLNYSKVRTVRYGRDLDGIGTKSLDTLSLSLSRLLKI